MIKVDVTLTETKVFTLDKDEVAHLVSSHVLRNHADAKRFNNVEAEIECDYGFTCRVTMRRYETKEESFP
jgi:hypothetical protein